MITNVVGDILTPGTERVIICHQVNCKGVMGAGLAKQIRTRYPYVFLEYETLCMQHGSALLGTVDVCDVDHYLIANVFGQDSYGRYGCYTDYKALRRAFKNLPRGKTVRIPYRMGCGLAGGDWHEVLSIITEELSDCDVEIWQLPNT